MCKIKCVCLTGETVELYYPFEIAHYIEAAIDYKSNLDKMFVLSGCYDDDIAHSQYFDERIKLRMWLYIYSLGGYNEVSEIDEEWTCKRNEGYKFTAYTGMRLKPKYQDMISAALDTVIASAKEAIRCYEIEQEELERTRKAEYEAALLGVKWDVKEVTIHDEGGKTTMYIHNFIIDGQKYKFTERNVFDFGRVINTDCGGMVEIVDGKCYHEICDREQGWKIGKPLSDGEARAYKIVLKYGKFADSHIRM